MGFFRHVRRAGIARQAAAAGGESVEDVIRTSRIIHIAILLGALMFGVVVLVLRREGIFSDSLGDELRIVAWIAAASALALVPAAFLLRGSLRAKIPTASGDAAAVVHYRTAQIVFLALLEGCIVLNLVACLLVGFVWNGAVAFAVWAVMAANWPTQDGFESLRKASG